MLCEPLKNAQLPCNCNAFDFNPISHLGGGHYGLDDQRSSAVSLRIALRSPNFLTLFLSMFYKSQKSRFQKKKFFAKNIERCQKYSWGGPFYAKIKIFKKNFFFRKCYSICLNINFTWSQLYFEVHSSSVAQNFKFFSFFPWNFQFWPLLLAWP